MKDLKMYINGQFVESKSGKWINVLNPSTEEVISRQPEGTVEEVDEALDAAAAAQKAWAKTPAIERAKYLNKMADGIRKRRDEFVDIIMREQGKTRTWASVEVDVTADYFDYMATFARQIEGEIIPSDRRGETIMLFKEPIGVVAGILPWNFPFFLIARKAGAALITGCTIVIKPSQLTPENCCEFAKVVDETGLPAGVFNVITGRGSVVGNALAASPKIGIVSVTGSVKGEHLIDYRGYYNYCMFIDYNAEGEPGKGSCIFLHCKVGNSTGGCVAIAQDRMADILRWALPGVMIVIRPA